MKFFIGFIVACVLWIFIIFLSNLEITRYKIYDCGMADWHPDIPNAVREECRKKSLEEWNNGRSKQII
jgi:hypothetical protein